MRTSKWMVAASLLVAMSATAQQPTDQSAQPQTAAPAAQPASPAPAQAQAAPQVPAVPATTMDQVVDRAIAREHALMTFLQSRTPLVETYLQNLKLDQQMGPSPSGDHYFLGRLDMGDTADRRDYLSKDESFQTRMLGGFSKLYRFQYQPMGFSWMIFVDRDDFDLRILQRVVHGGRSAHRVLHRRNAEVEADRCGIALGLGCEVGLLGWHRMLLLLCRQGA